MTCLVVAGYIFLPGWDAGCKAVRKIKAGINAGLAWFAIQFHIGFFRGAPGFAMIAFGAGAGDVFPGMLSSPVTGDDVIYG